MRLRIVVFAKPCGGARGVEVAQAHHAHAVPGPDVGEQPLEISLRLAVRIHRRLRRVLHDRDLCRMPVHRARGREDETTDLGANRRLQQYTGGRHIVGHILLRLSNRLRDEGEGGQVDDCLDALSREHRLDQLAVAYFPLDEAGTTRDCLTVTVAQVIEDDDLVPPIQELIDDDAADVARTPRDKDALRHSAPPPRGPSDSIPNSRRSASSRPYPRPSSAAALSAMLGWCRNLLSNAWLNCSTRARSSALKCPS